MDIPNFQWLGLDKDLKSLVVETTANQVDIMTILFELLTSCDDASHAPDLCAYSVTGSIGY